MSTPDSYFDACGWVTTVESSGKPDHWANPDLSLLNEDIIPPPALPSGVLPPDLEKWVVDAAEARGCPQDYPFAGLLAAASGLIGNSRVAFNDPDWSEPAVLWFALVGEPSAGKTPGLGVVLEIVSQIERKLVEARSADRERWREHSKVADAAEKGWLKRVSRAAEKGETPPERPDIADPGPEVQLPRLVVNDTTVERLGIILRNQPRGGPLLAVDKLAGWLANFERYSRGTDRPFWLSVYAARPHCVERVSREPILIDRAGVPVVGGIQPDRLRSLLLQDDDDGMAARFLPVWPHPVPIRQARRKPDTVLLDCVFRALVSLEPDLQDEGACQPRKLPIDDVA